MKKIVLVLAFLFSLAVPYKKEACFASSSIYARIKTDNVYLYSSIIDSESNKLFQVERTYFVELLENAGTDFYKAKYIDQYGYVKKDEVTPVKGTPSVPYADKVSFRVFALEGINMRSAPDDTTPFNIIAKIPYLSTNQIYYGAATGTEAVALKGNTWYYCKYLNGEQPVMGYVYSVFCDLKTSIAENTEVMEEVKEPIFDGDSTETQGQPTTLDGFSLPVQIAIIVGVSLPCLIILYLLFKPTKIMLKETTSKKTKPQVAINKIKPRKIKRARHADYYELDDLDY